MTALGAIAWLNGRVYTGRRFVEAALASDGTIAALGSDASVRREAPTGTEYVDLGGDWLLPGLIDAHCHLADALVAHHAPTLSDARSMEELSDRVRAAAGLRPSRALVVARGWDEAHLTERRYPTRDDIDAWPIDGPVVLLRTCHHVAAVNSLALERLGWSDATPDPPGGRLGREGGRLNGLLYEGALGALRPLFAEALDRLRSQVLPFLGSLNAYGLTTVAPMGVDAEELATVLAALSGAPPRIRLRPYLRVETDRALRPPTFDASGTVRIAGAKLYVDGSLGARTAWLGEAYSDAPTECGLGTLAGTELNAALEGARAAGLPVALHAIGDRAVMEVARALEEVPTVGPPRVEHASVTPPHVIRELARRRPVLVVQPHFVPSDSWLPERLGGERARWTYAFASLRGAGLTLAGSSDAPVEPFDPWSGMQAASARRAIAPSERLDPVAAFALYTTGAAVALQEPELGSLEVGARADAIRVSCDGWSDVITRGSGGLVATYLGGAPVFERPAQRGPRAQRR